MDDFFRGLTTLIKKYEKIIFMTHKNIDLDGFGSALCFDEIIKSFDKESYIYINKNKLSNQISKSIDLLMKKKIETNFINIRQLNQMSMDSTLLIIVDTYKIELIENKKILDIIDDVVIIDHHIVNNDNSIRTKLTYINSNLSSVIELMVNYLKYLNKKVDPLIATIMLAGIEIDTNSFKLKTTEKTYEAAAYLTSLGADNIIKQEILKEKKQDFLKRQEFIKKSYMINSNMALCTLNNKIFAKKDLATMAEELLEFDKTEASFVIGKIDKNIVGISARSLGKIDVFKICKKLGGGGHLANAAAQISNKSILEVKQMLLDIVK